MTVTYLTQFSMENITLNVLSLFYVALCVVEIFSVTEIITVNVISLVYVAFLCVVAIFSVQLLNREERLQDCLPRSETCDDSKADKNREFDLPCCGENEEDVSRGDAEEVMEKLGIFRRAEDGKIQESLGSDDLSKLFEEKEPSLEEVKGAFDVFDENGDGFIDSGELQRVLSVLGFKEGGEVEKCRRMIGSFDENGDGRIDFGEFVKILENSFC